MNRRLIASLALSASFLGSATVRAQTPRLDVTFFPSGHMVATAGKGIGQPEFRSVAPAAAVAVNLSSYFAVEGEITGALGVTQDLTGIGRKKTPAMLGYSGNIVANLAPHATWQPYLAVGVGQTRMFSQTAVGITAPENIETANAGGGVRIMFGRWGLRGDYRFVGMSSTAASASGFFGSDVRHAHRISLGFVVSPGRAVTPRG
jgi:hypothetical protein